ncbi:MAG: amidohydrolase [bacterium]|nr:amidohydrolase [bacterium]
MADLIIVNGDIWTGVPGAPRVQALAVAGERIRAVGTNADVRALAGPKTRVIDARGRLVVPGLTDAHTHFIEGGLQLSRVDLRDSANRAEFARRIAERARNTQPGQWILGGQWTVDSWADPAPPRKEWIDAVTGDVPVFVVRMDGHQALANSAALKLAGIDAAGPPDPQGGEIVRDHGTGEPTGILKDDAMPLVTSKIPPTSPEAKDAALTAAMRHVNAFGITSVHVMEDGGDLLCYPRALRRDGLTVRVRGYLMVEPWSDYFHAIGEFPHQDGWFSVLGFKGYVDGSLGSRTAYMRAPFADSTPSTKYPRGFLLDQADPFDGFAKEMVGVDAAGLQLAVHAIGDEANHLLLDAYANLQKVNGPRDRRPRIEHAQHLLPEDAVRFAKLGVIASMQPYHKADDGRWAEKALGPQRALTTYAFRSLLDSGATLVFGSDWPVVSANPFEGIEAAVTGRTLDGKVWVPRQNLSVEQALYAYAVAPAYASFAEAELGTLTVGKLADLAVLSQDIFTAPAQGISETRADLTIVGGKVVWSDN